MERTLAISPRQGGVMLGCLIIGAALGWLLIPHGTPTPVANAAYPLVNPFLTYDLPDTKQFKFDDALQKSLKSFVDKQTASGNAQDISIYYRDLPQGRWVGINENMTYDPASLMKVALVIGYYKDAQSDPDILSKKITYAKALDDAINEVPLQTPSNLTVGQSYTVDELIEDLMVNSDNGAKNALLSGIDENALTDVYSDLGIENPDNVAGDYVISAKAYSLFFRILYDATYLNRAMSQKALDLLLDAQYKDGLVAGIPSTTQIAQKFGEHISVDADGNPTEYELHDCGIIYKPQDSYTLCVMTRGADIGKLTDIIRQISQVVYQQAQ